MLKIKHKILNVMNIKLIILIHLVYICWYYNNIQWIDINKDMNVYEEYKYKE